MTRPIQPRLPALVLLAAVLGSGCSNRPPKTDGLPLGGEAAVRLISPRARFNTAFPSGNRENPRVHTLLLSADGSLAAVSNLSLREKKVQLWDVSGPPRKLREYEGYLKAFSPDGKRFVRSRGLGRREIVDVDGGQVLGRLNYVADHVYFRSPDVVVAMSMSHDWSRAQKFHVRQYDAATGKELSSFEGSDDDRVHICPPVNGGRELVLYVEKANRVQVWDLSARRLVREFPLAPPKGAGSCQGFVAGPDGKWLAVAWAGGTPTQVLDAATGSAVATLPRGLHAYHAAFAPGRDVYLTPSNLARADKTGSPLDVVAYDLQRRAVVAAFRGHQKPGLEVAVSADGKVMASGDEAGDVLLWDLGQLP
jgi:WD40 repeat protein